MIYTPQTKIAFIARTFAVICLMASAAACGRKSKVEPIASAPAPGPNIGVHRAETDGGEGLRLRPADEVAQRSSGYSTIYFDFDESAIRNDQMDTLDGVVTALRSTPEDRLILEGHCDERGTVEYNLLLGERRANTVKSFLVSTGQIQSNRLQVLSKGEEEPAVMGNDESAWSQNRRVEFIRAQ